jgi:hypothetical protein
VQASTPASVGRLAAEQAGADVDDQRNPQAVPGNSTAMNPVTPPQASMPSNRVGDSATSPTVAVQLTEYEIRIPQIYADERRASYAGFVKRITRNGLTALRASRGMRPIIAKSN